MRYAENTSVPIERTRVEIERVLQRYGARKFGTMTEPERATVYFEMSGRKVQLPVVLPTTAKDMDRMYERPKRGWTRPALDRALDQERRRRWRVLVITLKAMLEAVESEIVTFDEAFLAHIVVPGTGETIGQTLTPKLDALYQGTSMRALLAAEADR